MELTRVFVSFVQKLYCSKFSVNCCRNKMFAKAINEYVHLFLFQLVCFCEAILYFILLLGIHYVKIVVIQKTKSIARS